MQLSKSRLSLVTALSLAAAACGSDTASPAAQSWADGVWKAVRINGAPLPYHAPVTGNPYPYITYDSLDLYIFDPPVGTHAGDVFPYSTLYSSDLTAPTRTLCWDDDLAVTVTSTTLSTRAKGLTTTGGACNAAVATFDFTRKGDSLAGTWDGVEVRLVRAQPTLTPK